MADWETVLVVCAPLLVVYVLWEWLRKTRPLAIALRVCFLLYVIGLISVTLFPMPVTPAEIAYRRAFPEFQRGYNLVPFASMIETLKLPARPASVQLMGNFAMLFPLSFLAPLLWRRVNSFARAAGLVAVTSVSIEALQFFISLLFGFRYKSVDVDDIILNVAGGCLGYLAYRVVAPYLATLDFSRRRDSGDSTQA